MKKDEADTILNKKGLRWLFKWELSLASEDSIPFTAFQSWMLEMSVDGISDWIIWVTSSCQIEKVIERVRRWWGRGMYLTHVHCDLNNVSWENNVN